MTHAMRLRFSALNQ
ncbi:erythromycin resistance leader peptide [Virgibacillus sp. NKC19-3]|nr:erythromycin resistance leader peptide [Virgibacillus sp. NKC19-3]